MPRPNPTGQPPNAHENPHGNGAAVPAQPLFQDPVAHLTVYQGDSLTLLRQFPPDSADIIFADPPYFLSNDGVTCRAGKMVSVNKGEWDRSLGPEVNHEFNRAWLAACQRILKPNGTIWVTGTSHVIHSVGYAMQQLGFKLLNDIAWVKPNPPPNLSCRYFTHATETVIWAARSRRSRHTFNYALMRQLAGGKQMKSVWQIPAPGKSEKRLGSYPAQKPLRLLERILLASSDPGDTLVDPFMGSGTALVAACRLGRRAVGIDLDGTAITLSLIRIYSDLVHVAAAVLTIQMDLDPGRRSMDRSRMGKTRQPTMPESQHLLRRERNFYFIGKEHRDVVYSVSAEDMDDAWQHFRSTGQASSAILFVIKTETEIYLAL